MKRTRILGWLAGVFTLALIIGGMGATPTHAQSSTPGYVVRTTTTGVRLVSDAGLGIGRTYPELQTWAQNMGSGSTRVYFSVAVPTSAVQRGLRATPHGPHGSRAVVAVINNRPGRSMPTWVSPSRVYTSHGMTYYVWENIALSRLSSVSVELTGAGTTLQRNSVPAHIVVEDIGRCEHSCSEVSITTRF